MSVIHNQLPIITGEHIKLIPMNEDRYIEWFRQIHLDHAKMIIDDGLKSQFDRSVFHSWISTMISRNEGGIWLAVYGSTGLAFGAVYFTDYIPNLKAHIHPVAWKRGCQNLARRNGKLTESPMTTATRLMCEYLFNGLKLVRISADYYDINTPAINMCKKLGFKIEGVERQGVRVADRLLDFVSMGLLPNELKEAHNVVRGKEEKRTSTGTHKGRHKIRRAKGHRSKSRRADSKTS